MNLEIQKNIFHLKQITDEYPQVLAVYLFGSAVSGKTGPLSDIDLGILLTEEISSECQLELETQICSALKTDKIDIVFLNKIPLEAAYSIIKEGVCLYYKNKDKLAELIFLMISRYLDMKYYSDMYYQYRLGQIGK